MRGAISASPTPLNPGLWPQETSCVKETKPRGRRWTARVAGEAADLVSPPGQVLYKLAGASKAWSGLCHLLRSRSEPLLRLRVFGPLLGPRTTHSYVPCPPSLPSLPPSVHPQRHTPLETSMPPATPLTSLSFSHSASLNVSVSPGSPTTCCTSSTRMTTGVMHSSSDVPDFPARQ